ncbi:hypothetical protein [Enterococcus faecalis]|uniref:hypothetical protein n=1 Tax=Enterococcus faecalis TaxID=1351 RepID=UPI001030954D|nr:hypothetical protein [Enterococcus faecalis]TBH14684.1 hypothetical protein EYC52_13475 [Enterococcus faecalis]
MYYVEVETKGVKNKQYVKSMMYDEYPLLGSSQEAEPFSKECAESIKRKLESELHCGKASVRIVEEL